MSPRRRTAAVGVAVLGLLLAGCGGGSNDAAPASDSPAPSSSPSSSVAPTAPATATPAPRPEDGACFDVTYDAALAPTSDAEPVACDAEHTARTIAVGDLDLVVGGHLLAVDSERAQEQPAQRCPERLAEFLGGTTDDVRLSVLRAVWFSPTVEESDAGAGWFRCDLIALTRDETLAPLTGRLEGVLSRPEDAERWRVCGTAEPGTDGFERVACSEEHSWRALSVVELAATEEYPGEDTVSAAGDGTCEDAARDTADDPLNFRWGYEYPSADQWAAGQRYGLCWAPA